MRRWLAGLATMTVLGASAARGQELTGFERQRGLIMLRVVRDDIRKHYFDSLYAGLDLAAVFDTAEARIGRAGSVAQVLGAIAQATLELNDSHTLFLSPGLVYGADYGWTPRFVGDTCRVIKVKDGSDAQGKGIQLGDAVLSIEGFRLTRQSLWQLDYLLHALLPRPSVQLLVQTPGAEPRRVTVAAEIQERRRIVDFHSSLDIWDLIRDAGRYVEERAPRYVDLDQKVLLFRLVGFDADESWVHHFAKRVRGHEAVIVDLRGNHGGAVSSLLRFVGLFFENEVPVQDLVERRKHERLVAKGSGDKRFSGTLVVLVDAESASASEIFSRTMQLTGRGKVVGDRTAGMVRVSRVYFHPVGTETAALYGLNLTIADAIMPDGGKLERVGVIPDELLLPTGMDLRQRADPVLASALARVGVLRTPEQAGRLPWER